jgi:hypothetical protein
MYEEHVMSFLFFYLNEDYCPPNMMAVCSSGTNIKFPILHVESEEYRPLGRPRHRWEDIIKMDIQEKGWGRGLAKDTEKWRAVVNTGMLASQEGVCSFELEYTVSCSRRRYHS